MTKTNALRKIFQNVFGITITGNSVSSVIDNAAGLNLEAGGGLVIRATATLNEQPEEDDDEISY